MTRVRRGHLSSYKTSDEINADQVRIRFINDRVVDQTGYDRNLFVNNIQINGRNFDTADSSTLSTGTWSPEAGVQPGFGLGIVLHTDGYFQFEATRPAEGVQIIVNASGQTGDEIMSIRSPQLVPQNTIEVNTEAQDYIVDSLADIDLADVQISFLNDLYDPDNGYDRNLTIHSIRVVDLQTGETQSAFPSDGNDSVFSTGTWTAKDGIVDGFGRGDTLHGNGYFGFDQPVASSTSLQLDPSFGNGGEVEADAISLIASDSSGRVAYSTGVGFEIEVRDANGNLDTQFGGDGSVNLIDLIGPNLDGFIDQFLSPLSISDLEYTDRGLLVGGQYQPQVGFPNPTDVFVALLNPDGTLVDDYVNGVIEGSDIEIGAFGGGVQVTLDSESRTILSAETVFGTEPGPDDDRLPDLAVSRLDFFGSIDTSFGENGTTIVERPFADSPPFNTTRPLELLQATSDGGYVFATNSSTETSIIKLSANGNLDTSFGDAGGVVLDLIAVDVVIDQQNRIIVGGSRYDIVGDRTDIEQEGYSAYRLLSNGEFDSSFGDNGFAFATLDPTFELNDTTFDFFVASDVVVEEDGGILFVANAANRIVFRVPPPLVENAGTIVLRLDSDGNLDTEFGAPNRIGYELLAIGAGGQQVYNALLDSSGNLILAGFRYDSDDTLPTTRVISRFEFT